jgi:membrane protease YdiL (CAAX protease family)
VTDSTRDETEPGEEPEARSTPPVPFAAFLIYEAAVSPLALALGWALDTPPLASFAWDGRAAALGLVAALPMVAWLVIGLRRSFPALERIKQFLRRELLPVIRDCRWPDLALLSAVAGIGEEMLFRGVIQAALTRSLGAGPAIAAASVLCGLLHPISFANVVITAGLGAYLGLVWRLSGNLLTVMIAHAVYDFCAFGLLLRDGDD